MTADFSLVVHTAKRNSGVFSAKRSCYGSRNRGFTNTGRANKTNNLVFYVGAELLNCNEFENSVLHLCKTVVVCVENILRLANRHSLGGFNSEGIIKAGVKVSADNSALCSAKGCFCELGKFLIELFSYLLRHISRCNFIIIFLDFVVLILAELGLKSLYLLSEEIILLIPINLLAYLLLNIVLALENHKLLAKSNKQAFKPCFCGDGFKHRLLIFIVNNCAGGYKVGKVCRIGNSLCGNAHFFLKCGVQALDLTKNIFNLEHKSLTVIRRLESLLFLL